MRIDQNNIAYLKFICEGYDGLAIVSSENAPKGAVHILYSSTQDGDAGSFISAMIQEGVIKEVITNEKI